MKFLCVYPTHSDQYAIHSTSVFNVLWHSEEYLKKKKRKKWGFWAESCMRKKNQKTSCSLSCHFPVYCVSCSLRKIRRNRNERTGTVELPPNEGKKWQGTQGHACLLDTGWVRTEELKKKVQTKQWAWGNGDTVRCKEDKYQ